MKSASQNANKTATAKSSHLFYSSVIGEVAATRVGRSKLGNSTILDRDHEPEIE